MTWRVLVSSPQIRPSIDRYRDLLAREGIEIEITNANQMLSEAELLEIIEEFDGVIASDDEFTERVLRSAPRLKVVSKWGTGVDSIDLEVAAELGIRVMNTPGAFSDAVADVVMGYVVLFARQIVDLDASVRKGGWEKKSGMELRGRRLGVVGVGRVGSEVVRRSIAFGMDVVGTDPVKLDAGLMSETGLAQVELEELLSSADFVSINCDLNSTSRGLIGEPEFELMKPTAVLVNTARGPVVQERALVNALQRGEIAGAALDVFEHEPLPVDSPLRRLNCILSPHNAYNTVAAVERVNENTVRNLIEGLSASRIGRRGKEADL